MASVDYVDYLEAGYHIFPLHPIIDGKCACGDEDCPTAGKHPAMSNWQYVTTWDEEQLSLLEDDEGLTGRNQFATGFGVNLAGRNLLVVDVDPRNGGVASYAKLSSDLKMDIREQCGFIVRTGSGGEAFHAYFTLSAEWNNKALLTTLKEYPGIDFKTTGFVVGCGSEHLSGNLYEAIGGTPESVQDAPQELLGLLRRPERMRTVVSGTAMDFTHDELVAVVRAIRNDKRDYEKFIRIGMGIHDATNGSLEGYDLWIEWSSQSDMHDDSKMEMKWHSFGKSVSPVTLATLYQWAKDDGYSEPVTFTDDTQWEPEPAFESGVTSKASIASVNLKRPPGLVGQVTQWINDGCLFPRENLAVGAALMAVSNAAGMRYRVEKYNTTLNLMLFGVAGSGTGKESVYQKLIELQIKAGVGSAVHGGIKSEQEIIRNALRHQAALYTVDEVGAMLSKIGNSKKTGKTPYMEGVTAAIIAMFSKADGYYPVTGDMKEEVMQRVERDIARVQKALDNQPTRSNEIRLENLLKERSGIQNGIEHPFLSFYGTSEPVSFNEAVNGDYQMVVGGFLGRSVIMEEQENVPMRKDSVNNDPLPSTLHMRLAGLYGSGSAGAEVEARVERQGDTRYIGMSDDAQKAADDVYHYWRGIALAEQDEGTGLEAVANRSWELTIKVAAVLAVESEMITAEHMRYAHALIHKSTMLKMNKAKAAAGAESKDTEEKSAGVLAAITAVMEKNHEITLSAVTGRYRSKYTKEQVQQGIDYLVGAGKVERLEVRDSGNRLRIRYKLT